MITKDAVLVGIDPQSGLKKYRRYLEHKESRRDEFLEVLYLQFLLGNDGSEIYHHDKYQHFYIKDILPIYFKEGDIKVEATYYKGGEKKGFSSDGKPIFREVNEIKIPAKLYGVGEINISEKLNYTLWYNRYTKSNTKNKLSILDDINNLLISLPMDVEDNFVIKEYK